MISFFSSYSHSYMYIFNTIFFHTCLILNRSFRHTILSTYINSFIFYLYPVQPYSQSHTLSFRLNTYKNWLILNLTSYFLKAVQISKKNLIHKSLWVTLVIIYRIPETTRTRVLLKRKLFSIKRQSLQCMLGVWNQAPKKCFPWVNKACVWNNPTYKLAPSVYDFHLLPLS